MTPFFWMFMHDYQRNRILNFLDPNRDPYGMGYNVMQSQIAVGSGGMFGLGVGKGWQSQMNFLPVAYSDFAFAVLAEAFGFVGSTLALLSYLYIIWYIWNLAFKTVDRFAFYILSGIGSVLIFQIFVNIGMNLGVVPVTGIPLPLISSGRTAIVVTMVFLGLVLSIRSKTNIT
jgi:rod shape determining protein RodA